MKNEIKSMKQVKIHSFRSAVRITDFDVCKIKSENNGMIDDDRWFKQILHKDWCIHLFWDRVVVFK